MSAILSDSGQEILSEDVDRILSMAYDSFINEHNSKEYRYTDQEVCDYFDISQAELDKAKYTLSYEYNNRG